MTKVDADWAAFLAQQMRGRAWPGYGVGADLDASISTTVNLSREMHYRNLEIASGGRLNTMGFIVRVQETLTIQSGALGILDVGLSASGTTPGGARAGAYVWLGQGGAVGITGAGDGLSPPAGNRYSFGGKGGNGAASSGHAFGAGGVAIDHIQWDRSVGTGDTYYATPGIGCAQQDGAVDIINAAGSVVARQFLVGGMGGGSGGCESGNSSGAGGAGGGVCMVFAKHIVIVGSTAGYQGSQTAYSPICAQGGAGGNSTNNAGGAGGGGGGGGGTVIVVCADWSGVALTGACVAGGKGGNPGVGGGGAAGNAGKWTFLQVV